MHESAPPCVLLSVIDAVMPQPVLGTQPCAVHTCVTPANAFIPSNQPPSTPALRAAPALGFYPCLQPLLNKKKALKHLAIAPDLFQPYPHPVDHTLK
jgi:hypothetical protein